MSERPAFTIARIGITSFRSISDLDLILDPRMTVITGQNGVGKTAAIDAIGCILGRSLEPTDIREGCERATLVAKLNGSAGSEATIRVVCDRDGSEAREQLALVHRKVGRPVESLKIGELRKLIDELGIPSPGGARRQPLLDAVQEWLGTEEDAEFEEVWGPMSADVRTMLPGLETYSSTSAPNHEALISTLVRRTVQEGLLAPDQAKSLTAIETALRPGIEAAVADIRRRILKFCPDFEDISVHPDIDFSQPRIGVMMSAAVNGANVELSKCGEGANRRITLAIHEARLEQLRAARTGAIICYDEPDSNLDYGSQRELFDILQDQALAQGTQVVVATHSLNFIDRVDLSSVRHLVARDAGTGILELLQSEDAELLDALASSLGPRNSILLGERVFLVVEGETEEAAMPLWIRSVCERSAPALGIVVFNTQGSGALRKLADQLVRWGRTVVALLDEDQRTLSQEWLSRSGFEEDRTVFFVGTKELEDAFADQTWANILNQDFQPIEGRWTCDDVAELRASEKFSEALADQARRRCQRNVKKPDLGLALGNRIGPAVLPEAIKAAIAACLP